MSVDEGPIQSVPPYIQLKAGEHQIYFAADGYVPESVTATVRAGEDRNFVVTLQPANAFRPPANAARTTTPPSAASPAARQPAAAAAAANAGAAPDASTVPPPPAPVENGLLAVNAAVPAEIYSGDRLLGATPTSLRLPAGSHTLEFRYRQLRKTETVVIRPEQTTSTTVVFDVTVRINARPYAQVFIDGPRMTPLGETPLGSVTIPAGSVLVFRHPTLPEKRFRVTGAETTIQVSMQ
jgi:hypothetical protein